MQECQEVKLNYHRKFLGWTIYKNCEMFYIFKDKLQHSQQIELFMIRVTLLNEFFLKCFKEYWLDITAFEPQHPSKRYTQHQQYRIFHVISQHSHIEASKSAFNGTISGLVRTSVSEQLPSKPESTSDLKDVSFEVKVCWFLAKRVSELFNVHKWFWPS